MKLSKIHLTHKKVSKKHAMEDMRYLQKKISGSSVYTNIRSVYRRIPKHRGRSYMAEFKH